MEGGRRCGKRKIIKVLDPCISHLVEYEVRIKMYSVISQGTSQFWNPPRLLTRYFVLGTKVGVYASTNRRGLTQPEPLTGTLGTIPQGAPVCALHTERGGSTGTRCQSENLQELTVNDMWCRGTWSSCAGWHVQLKWIDLVIATCPPCSLGTNSKWKPPAKSARSTRPSNS